MLGGLLKIDLDKLLISKAARQSLKGYEKEMNNNVSVSFYAGGAGNFGDWLSIYLIYKITNKGIKYTSLRSERGKIICIGSVISGANKNTKVLGAGIASLNDKIDEMATIVGVRGGETYKKLAEHQKKTIRFVCDPGFFMPNIYNGRHMSSKRFERKNIFIAHINHGITPKKFNGSWEELSIKRRTADEIEELLNAIIDAEVIATTAMHVAIVAAAYRKRIVLYREISPNKIPGDGIKYEDAFHEKVGAIKQVYFDKEIEINEDDAEATNLDYCYINACYEVFKKEVMAC